MPRSLLQDVVAYDFEAKLGIRIGSFRQTITATFNMADDMPVEANLIASGGNQTVVLPSILGTTAGTRTKDRRLHIIANVGLTNNLLVVEHADDGGTAVITLIPGAAVILISDLADDKWILISGGLVTGTQAASLTAVTTTQPTLTAFGFTTTAQFNALVNDVNSIITALKTSGLMVSP